MTDRQMREAMAEYVYRSMNVLKHYGQPDRGGDRVPLRQARWCTSSMAACRASRHGCATR